MTMAFDDFREDWRAAAPTGDLTPIDPADRTEFINHWWGSTLPDLTSHEACFALMRSTQAFHQNSRGWADIGYNGVVCAHARRIEARGIDVQGAHASAHNAQAYGWCFMTPLEGHPTDDMLRAMVDALTWCEEHSGHRLTAMGHMDANPGGTDCPGSWIEAWVKGGMVAPQPPTGTPMTFEQAERIIAGQDRLNNAVLDLANAMGSMIEAQRLASKESTSAIVNLAGEITTLKQNVVTKGMTLRFIEEE